MEADALTLDVTESAWPVREFPSLGTPPHRKWFAISYDRGKTWQQPLQDYYDLSSPKQTSLSFKDLCNYLVHHFAFEVRYDSDADEVEILFNSNWTKDRALWLITLTDYSALIEEIHYDEIRWVDMHRGEGRVIQRRARPVGE